jgi:hypothetical protein
MRDCLDCFLRLTGLLDSSPLAALLSNRSYHHSLAAIRLPSSRASARGHLKKTLVPQNLISIVATQPNATSVWLYLFSSNRIEFLLVLAESESRQQKVTYSLADSVVFE